MRCLDSKCLTKAPCKAYVYVFSKPCVRLTSLNRSLIKMLGLPQYFLSKALFSPRKVSLRLLLVE